MATTLTKDVTRESTVQFDGREIMVTLTENQKVKLKLKGMKSGAVSIDILKLYKQLKGIEGTIPEKKDGPVSVTRTTKNEEKDDDLISLNDLRSHNAVANASVELVSHLDGIIKSVIDSNKR